MMDGADAAGLARKAEGGSTDRNAVRGKRAESRKPEFSSPPPRHPAILHH
jgi:hypothetical protein